MKSNQIRTTYTKLTEKLKEISYLEGVTGLLNWDQNVTMPSGAGEARGQQMAVLAGVINEKKKSTEIGDLIAQLEPHAQSTTPFNEYELAVIRDARREYDQAMKIPNDLAMKDAELSNRGYRIWVEARKNSDFASFAPILKEWIELKKQIAQNIHPDWPVYDVCIDAFERGMTSKRFEGISEEIKAFLVPFIQKIQENKKNDPALEFDRTFLTDEAYDTAKQSKLGASISKTLGFDLDERGRMDVSVHPFTGGAHRTDVRITTRYSSNLLEGVMGTIHETGHGIYEQNLNPEYSDTPVSRAISMGIHESQSLFYERMIGQNIHFWKYYWTLLTETFPGTPVVKRNVQDFYRALNVATPSLIRVDADEVTYSMHVIIRFEIEKGLFDGTINVDDLPKIWNEKMQKYLGITPPDNAKGVLQDVHWSGGAFGYFPSYMLGAAYACQWWNSMLKDLPDLEKLIETGDFAPIKKWLNEKVHVKGSLYPCGDDLLRAVTGEPLNPKHFLEYLTKKYTALYHLK